MMHVLTATDCVRRPGPAQRRARRGRGPFEQPAEERLTATLSAGVVVAAPSAFVCV